MNSPIPKHESVIDFDIAKVKEAISKFIELNKASDFYLKDRNDIFGTYVFNIFKNNSWNGLSSGSMHVTLQVQENDKTKVVVETLNNGQNQYVNIRDLTDAQTAFLKALSSILSGDYNPQSVVVPKGQGCLGIILFILAGSGIVSGIVHLLTSN